VTVVCNEPEAYDDDAVTRFGSQVPFAVSGSGTPESLNGSGGGHAVAGNSVTLPEHDAPFGPPHEQLVHARVSVKLVAVGITTFACG
jgi:hypothetical protein